MSKEVELKPCQCGSEAHTASTVEYGSMCRFVRCTNSKCGLNNLDGEFQTIEEAIAAWNTRAGEHAAYERGKAEGREAGKQEERRRIVAALEVERVYSEQAYKEATVPTLERYYYGRLKATETAINIINQE